MSTNRKIAEVLTGKTVMEGAGVRLKRIFGFYEKNTFDPFLLLDNFGSDNPADYLAGFPWHPHRGMETVTYMLEGSVEHSDSLGNKGEISTGDVQWMTAGSGIVHQEMPKAYEGTMKGFQLWVNLPAKNKMMKPRYQEVPAATIPSAVLEEGISIKVIAGEIGGTNGPVTEIVADTLYFDVSMNAGKSLKLQVNPEYTVIACVYEGVVYFDKEKSREIFAGQLVNLVDGDEIEISTADSPAKFIFISGKPLNEPVAWGGPIVMNTQEELNQAFLEYRNGTFIKK